MSQHDFDIANQTASNARADINNAFKALASLSSGSTAPSTTYANMLWYDTGNNIIKMRSEADDAWINIGTLNQSTDEFEVAGLTTLSEATWETGTSTTESLVSPAKVTAALNQELQDFAEGAMGSPGILGHALARDTNTDDEKALPVVGVTAADTVAAQEGLRTETFPFPGTFSVSYRATIQSYSGTMRIKATWSDSAIVTITKNGSTIATGTATGFTVDSAVSVDDVFEASANSNVTVFLQFSADDAYVAYQVYGLASKKEF